MILPTYKFMATGNENQSVHPLSGNASRPKYDVVVIGAGVVGCAVARHFSLEGAKVLIIEKCADILEGASKGNTAILHGGFDATPNSLEHACIRDGCNEYLRIRSQLNLPLLKTGALVLAWTQDEVDQLNQVIERAHGNGIDDAQLLTAKEIIAREPHLSSNVKAGAHIPAEYVIDPWTTPHAYLLQAIENGACLIRNCEVLSGEYNQCEWKLATTRGALHATFAINCAGLYADMVDTRMIEQTSFQIRPLKGQFLVYDKSASRLLNSIIFPLPNEQTKGVIICRTVFGNVLVGPTSESQESRNNASVNETVLKSLRQLGEKIFPSLAQHPIVANYAGIRPATEFRDYCIQAHADKNYISVGGIRSTGLSAALGIARYVFKQYAQLGHRHTAPAQCIWPAVSSIAEHRMRDWQRPGNGGIICHCELVTKREIQQALNGRIPVASINGLKRRTRATMGRCQGFYCYARLCELTQEHFAEEIAVKQH